MNNTVIDRIVKLIILATDSDTPEARNTAVAAARLMRENEVEIMPSGTLQIIKTVT